MASGKPLQGGPRVEGEGCQWQNQQSRTERKAPAPDTVMGRPPLTLVKAAEAWPQGAKEWRREEGGSTAKTRGLEKWLEEGWKMNEHFSGLGQQSQRS